jgi:uncharacterized DUF497 family protein
MRRVRLPIRLSQLHIKSDVISARDMTRKEVRTYEQSKA